MLTFGRLAAKPRHTLIRASTPTPTMTATRIDCGTSQDGKHRYEIIHYSTAQCLPNLYFLLEYNPNKSPRPSATYHHDVCDEANTDIQYYWAFIPPGSYFAPSEKARKESARTIYGRRWSAVPHGPRKRPYMPEISR